MNKIDETMSVIEESKIETCQGKLAEGKKIILKQEKLLKITDREEDGWEVVKCYMSDLKSFKGSSNKQKEKGGK